MTIKISGFKNLEGALLQLKTASSKRIGRAALKKAGSIISDSAKDKAPERTGGLRESVGVSGKLNKSQKKASGSNEKDEISIYVGPSLGLGKGGRHGHLLEFGTRHIKAQPFMRPAWESNKQSALKVVTECIKLSVDRAAKRAKKRK